MTSTNPLPQLRKATTLNRQMTKKRFTFIPQREMAKEARLDVGPSSQLVFRNETPSHGQHSTFTLDAMESEEAVCVSKQLKATFVKLSPMVQSQALLLHNLAKICDVMVDALIEARLARESHGGDNVVVAGMDNDVDFWTPSLLRILPSLARDAGGEIVTVQKHWTLLDAALSHIRPADVTRTTLVLSCIGHVLSHITPAMINEDVKLNGLLSRYVFVFEQSDKPYLYRLAGEMFSYMVRKLDSTNQRSHIKALLRPTTPSVRLQLGISQILFHMFKGVQGHLHSKALNLFKFVYHDAAPHVDAMTNLSCVIRLLVKYCTTHDTAQMLNVLVSCIDHDQPQLCRLICEFPDDVLARHALHITTVLESHPHIEPIQRLWVLCDGTTNPSFVTCLIDATKRVVTGQDDFFQWAVDTLSASTLSHLVPLTPPDKVDFLIQVATKYPSMTFTLPHHCVEWIASTLLLTSSNAAVALHAVSVLPINVTEAMATSLLHTLKIAHEHGDVAKFGQCAVALSRRSIPLPPVELNLLQTMMQSDVDWCTIDTVQAAALHGTTIDPSCLCMALASNIDTVRITAANALLTTITSNHSPLISLVHQIVSELSPSFENERLLRNVFDDLRLGGHVTSASHLAPAALLPPLCIGQLHVKFRPLWECAMELLEECCKVFEQDVWRLFWPFLSSIVKQTLAHPDDPPPQYSFILSANTLSKKWPNILRLVHKHVNEWTALYTDLFTELLHGEGGGGSPHKYKKVLVPFLDVLPYVGGANNEQLVTMCTFLLHYPPDLSGSALRCLLKCQPKALRGLDALYGLASATTTSEIMDAAQILCAPPADSIVESSVREQMFELVSHILFGLFSNHTTTANRDVRVACIRMLRLVSENIRPDTFFNLVFHQGTRRREVKIVATALVDLVVEMGNKDMAPYLPQVFNFIENSMTLYPKECLDTLVQIFHIYHTDCSPPLSLWHALEQLSTRFTTNNQDEPSSFLRVAHAAFLYLPVAAQTEMVVTCPSIPRFVVETLGDGSTFTVASTLAVETLYAIMMGTAAANNDFIHQHVLTILSATAARVAHKTKMKKKDRDAAFATDTTRKELDLLRHMAQLVPALRGTDGISHLPACESAFTTLCLFLRSRARDKSTDLVMIEAMSRLVPCMPHDVVTHHVTSLAELLGPASPYVVKERETRAKLIDGMFVGELGILLAKLNSYTKRGIDEFDYDIRRDAYKIVTEEAGTPTNELSLLALTHQCAYDCTSTDYVIRTAASLALKSILNTLQFVSSTTTPSNLVVARTITKSIANVLKQGKDVSYEVYKTFMHLFRDCVIVATNRVSNNTANDPLATVFHHDLAFLVDAQDVDMDFFLTASHIQILRRARALNKLADVLQEKNISESSQRMLLCIAEGALLQSEEETQTAGVNLLKTISKHLSVDMFMSVLDGMLKRQRFWGKIAIRAACTMVEVIQPQHHDGVDLVARFLGKFEAILHKAKNKRIDPRVANAVVRLLRLDPEHHGERVESFVLTMCAELLVRSQAARDHAREALCVAAVEFGPSYLAVVLRSLASTLRVGYQVHVLGYTINAVLKRVAPVLGNSTIITNPIDDLVSEVLVPICQEELFGELATQKESRDKLGGYRSNMREAKTWRSFDIYETIASCMTFLPCPTIHALLAPCVKYAAEKDSILTSRCRELVKRIAIGLDHNPTVQATELLILVHHLLTSFDREHLGVEEVGHHHHQWIGASTDRIREEAAKQRIMVGRAYAQRLQYEPGEKMTGAKAFHRRNPILEQDEALENSNAAKDLLTEFGLELLNRNLASRKVTENFFPLEPLNALLPFIADLIVSREVNDRIVMGACKAFRTLLASHGAILDTFKTNTKRVVDALLMVLSSTGAAGGGGSGNESNSSLDMADACLKTYTSIVRDGGTNYVPTKSHLQVIFHTVEPFLEDSERQNTALALIRAVVHRRVLLAEVYDVCFKVAKVVFVGSSPTVRQSSAKIVTSFLMDYPMEQKRLTQYVELFVGNLNFPHEDGRKAGLEFLQTLVMRFPVDVVDELAEYLVLPLVIRMVEEPSPACAQAAAETLSQLFTKVTIRMLKSLALELIASWFKAVHTMRAACQTAGILAMNLATRSGGVGKQIARELIGLIEAMLQRNDVEWETVYHGLIALGKFKSAGGYEGHEAFLTKQFVVSMLTHTHPWVRGAFARYLLDVHDNVFDRVVCESVVLHHIMDEALQETLEGEDVWLRLMKRGILTLNGDDGIMQKIFQVLNDVTIMTGASRGDMMAMSKWRLVTECVKTILSGHGDVLGGMRQDIVSALIKAQGMFDGPSTPDDVKIWTRQVLDRMKLDMGEDVFVDVVSNIMQAHERKRQDRRTKRKFDKVLKPQRVAGQQFVDLGTENKKKVRNDDDD